MRLDLLLSPGYGNSSPDHWQSHWARLYENASRVLQDDWETPSLEAWLARLEAALANGRHPALIVAHSRGCSLAVHWAARRQAAGAGFGRVRGLLLVAPPDLDSPDFPGFIRGDFAPMPREALGLKTILVASRNDPYCRFDRAEEMALDWNAEFVDAGDKGHINALSGLGEWLEGRALLERLAVHAQAQGSAPAASAPISAAPADVFEDSEEEEPAEASPPPAAAPVKRKRARRAGSAQDRMAEMLEERRPEAFCDECVTAILGFKHQAQANQAARALEQEGVFQRRTARCARCGGTKKATFRI